MDDYITQIGVGGILAVIIIDRILSFLKAKKANGNGMGRVYEEIHELARLTKEMYDWHKPGKDGFMWYSRDREIREELRKLREKIDKQ